MDDRTMIEWDKDDLDALGILKVDVLALGMLTCIRKASIFSRKHYGIAQLTWRRSRKEDEQVYDMICQADTIGVFQIESRAQMSMLPRLRPRKFLRSGHRGGDRAAGPDPGRHGASLSAPAAKARAGRTIPSEELRAVLGKHAWACRCSRSRRCRIAIVAAGFTPGEADQLRRAMATFRHAGTIDAFSDKLIEGMEANGL